ncbi:MAG: thioredoxin family protein [Armatimonadaceae bacterium]
MPFSPIRLLAGAGLALLLSLSLLPQGTPARSQAPPSAQTRTLTDIEGKAHPLGMAKKQPTVFLFLSVECPIANRYTPRIVALASEYGAKGVAFFAVYPNQIETVEAVRQHSGERKIGFPVVRDSGALTKEFGATTTPEAVVLDGSGKVRYQGRIDDNADTIRVRTADLRNALDAVLAGKPVQVARTRPFGCLISGTKTATPTATTSLTYSRDIAPILYKNCVSCHRTGEVGPFALDTYERAVAWAQQIKIETQARRMPPWKADASVKFHDEMRLSDRERAQLAEWADGGTPEGDPKTLPPMPVFASGWKLGKPDVVFTMPEAYRVPAEGRDTYRCFVIPTNFDEEVWIEGVEYQAGNKAVVHHMSGFVDTTGQARRLAEADKSGPGYTNPTPANGPGFTPVAGQLGGWVPGHFARRLPEGVGVRVPKGGDIVLEVHYHPTGKVEKDQSRLGLYFARGPIRKQLRLGDVSNVNFRIPPGEQRYKIDFSAYVPEDITLLSVSPHMHYLGKSMKATVTFPDGTTHPLVNVPSWDFRWQPSYRLKTPMKIPRRSRIDVVAVFDNSAENPDNPFSPPRTIVYGEGTSDEMCTLFVAYTSDSEDLTTEPVLVP